MALLQEFLNENQHRNYPLADNATARDITDSINLPQSLMSDMVLNVPASYNSGSTPVDMSLFFVSNVLIRSMSADITISYQSSSGAVEVAVAADIPMDAPVHTSYNMSALPQADSELTEFESVTGSVTIGLTEEARAYPGSWSFDQFTGKLIVSVIHAGIVGVRQITVGPDTFSGNVVLKEGTNVTLDSVYDSVHDKTIITISSTQESSTSLVDDDSIYEALKREFGEPLTRINNIAPTNQGSFTLSGLDCTRLTNITGGLSITNPCSKPCCDKSYMDAAYDALAELNSRYARLIDFYVEVRANINDMQNKLAMLQLNTNIDV